MKRVEIILIILICMVQFNSFGLKDYNSPFNSKSIATDSSGNYSFIVSGHFHGDGHNRTGYPTNTLLANLDWINNSKSSMVVCLGDLFLDVSNDIPNYESSFFSKLNLPLYNAVGNHDLTGDIYQEHFGETYFYFMINNDIHLFFDTEINDGSIKNQQLKMLNEVNEMVIKETINNLFIYSHRTIWSKTYSDLDLLFKDNTQSSFGNNFESDVLPIIEAIQVKTQVYWFSGSLGNAPASFFQYKNEKGIQFVGTAIRGLKRDAVLVVNVIGDEVRFVPKSFTGETLLKFEDYNTNYWNENVGVEPFNYRLIPLYLKQIFFDIHFWYGIVLMLFITSVYYFRKKKKNKNEK